MVLLPVQLRMTIWASSKISGTLLMCHPVVSDWLRHLYLFNLFHLYQPGFFLFFFFFCSSSISSVEILIFLSTPKFETLLQNDYENLNQGCPRGVMAKAMDCGIVVSEFVLQSRSLSGKYPWERYEPPYPPSYGLNSTTTVLLGE